MKKINKKAMVTTGIMMVCLMATMMFASADAPKWNEVYEPIVELIDSLLFPLLMIVGAVGTLFCVFLGVKFAKAEDPQEHEKAKKGLRNAIIGFVLIFVLIGSLKLGMPIMKNWVQDNYKVELDNTQNTGK